MSAPVANEIRFEGLGLEYTTKAGPIQAIKNLTGTVPAGKFVSLIGPSGCGKSSLLDIASSLVRPTSGSMLVDGKEVREPRASTSMVFQEAALLPWRTILDNVAFPLEVRGVGKRARHDRARELLRTVGLEGFAEQRPNSLSGGMRQRAAIARALSTEPTLLLMDEPFGALDQQTRMIMCTQLTEIWEQFGCTVLFVTHDIGEAIALSDLVWVMSRRPGSIKREVVVDLPRPRAADLPTNPRFQELEAELWSLLREEADAMHLGTSTGSATKDRTHSTAGDPV
ncbi:NitT/TauT family transport system ATP-binding protein [Actinomadura hallensis]|uniref:NitT/TauT family transport system ATP-binding protein n=1 Tax=Actinomadura hallensis TaxID=337895 RepID=A0A543I7W0_9ACTN|nr:ABC transporter ATP-binding protein [Actinomadura hallensis]TQM66639.1 NitT/TauT family transport system ATP-binding protein [Actinomadura hallensis]